MCNAFKLVVCCLGLTFATGYSRAADKLQAPLKTQPQLSVDTIVEKNIAARGGRAAWRAVQSMKLSGKLDAGGKPNAQLPFALEMKRPLKMRLELEFNEQTAVQVYDGERGWKIRPFLNRREVEPYSDEETRKARLDAGLDGPLFDHAAKGIRVELEGVDTVEGKDAYRLKLIMKDGQVRRLWIDAQTFLETRIDGSRRIDGKMHVVWTYYRGYRSIQGLMIPFLYETTVEGVKGAKPEKIVVENVVVNANLDDKRFAKPQ